MIYSKCMHHYFYLRLIRIICLLLTTTFFYEIFSYKSGILSVKASTFQKYARLHSHLDYKVYSDKLNQNNKYSNDNNKIIEDVIDLAECSSQCDSSISHMLSNLGNKRKNIQIIQRNINKLGIRYNIIKYDNLQTNEKRLVIAIRGTKNFLNIKSDLDCKLEYDDLLNIQVHRGFKQVYRAILNDMLDQSNPSNQFLELYQYIPSNKFNIFQNDLPTLLITGHSLGGATAYLLGAALKKQLQITVNSIVGFGVPKFTNRLGSETLSNLPVTLVEHILDPIVGITPFTLPFVSHNYYELTPKNLLLLEPIDRLKSKNAISQSFQHRICIGKEVFNRINKQNDLPKKIKWHYMKSYLAILQNLAYNDRSLNSFDGLVSYY